MDAIITRARPNPAHYALAELEAKGFSWASSPRTSTTCTRPRAPNGWWSTTATPCASSAIPAAASHPRETLDFSHTPLYCLCGGLIRPDVVFFGEAIPAGGPDRGRGPGPALRPAPGHRHLRRSGPGQLHPRHRQGMARPHRRKQPGTHPPDLHPHRPLPPRPRRAIVAQSDGEVMNMTCIHGSVECLNHYEFFRKYRCKDCGQILMCECERKLATTFLPHQISFSSEYEQEKNTS